MHNPSPDKYVPPPGFGSQQARRSYSFGLSRESVKNVTLPYNPPSNAFVPGPGAYQNKETVGKEGARYSMGLKSSTAFMRLTAASPGQTIHSPGSWSL